MRARKGFALMASLWLTVAIAALSLRVSTEARDFRLAAANSLEGQRAKAAAVSGVDHARARLSRIIVEGGDRRGWRDPQRLADPWFRLDTALASVLGDMRYEVRLHDLGGRLNVNRATDADLRRYFTGLRIDAARVEAMVQGIADWKDADDNRRTQGAERDEYLRGGAQTLPRNGGLASVEELTNVAGVSPELMRRVRSDFTVRGTGQINVNSASRSVLLSLPGFTEQAAEVIVREQEAGRRVPNWNALVNLVPRQARAPLEGASGQLISRVIYETREVGVESTGRVEGSPVEARTAAVLVRAGTNVFVTWSAVR
jgi:general secretion pathway protein K